VAHDWPVTVQSALVQHAALETHELSGAPHCFSPVGHAHCPPGMGHTWPVMVHSPLLQHVPVGMQVPEAGQPTWPAGQVPTVQVPLVQVPPQTMPQPPQFIGSVFRLEQ
jgi:hypothetical protein